MGTLGSFPGGPHEYRGLEAHGNLCILFKHWFRWKYQYNKYMFNFIDIFSFIPVSGCVVQPGAPVHCFARGGYYAVKTALPTILNVIKIWLAPLYWYVAVREIWGYLIMVHMWVTLGLSTIQWEWWMWDNESVTKLLCMLWAIRLAKKDQNSINHTIIYSWH